LVLEVLHNRAIQQQQVEAVVMCGMEMEIQIKELEVEVEVQEVLV
jgi:hypothetical protein